MKDPGSVPRLSVQNGNLHEYLAPSRLPQKQKEQIELNILRLFICCALPWNVMDSPFFKDFIASLNPTFTVPDRSAFFTKHLPQEVAIWESKFKVFLQQKKHLTFSLDGWSTRAKDEVYASHTTIPSRRSFFTNGYIFRGESVTGNALKVVIIRVSVIYNLCVAITLNIPTRSFSFTTLHATVRSLVTVALTFVPQKRSLYKSINGF